MFKFDTKAEQNLAKEIYREKTQTGVYKYFDPITGKLKEEGRFKNGEEVGIWKTIDDDGDQRYFEITKKRIGAICRDGTTSQNTGHGACSRHGGVAEWVFQNVYTEVGGTGKYLIPIKQRVQQLKQKVKSLLKIEDQGLEFQQTLLKIFLNIYEENSVLKQRESISTIRESNESPKRLETLAKVEDSKFEKLKKSDGLASTNKVITQKTVQKGLVFKNNKDDTVVKKLQFVTSQKVDESFLSADLGSDSEEDEGLTDPQKNKNLQKGGNQAEENSIQGFLKHLKLN